MKTQDDLGLTFESVAAILGYDLNNIDEFAEQAIQNELNYRKHLIEVQEHVRSAKGKNFRFDGFC